MNYLGNAFSAGMLEGNAAVDFTFITLEKAKAYNSAYKFESCIGHADTALLVSSLLEDKTITMNRCSTVLRPGDVLLIAQYNGPRLSEGAINLPEGAKIRWIMAEIRKQ